MIDNVGTLFIVSTPIGNLEDITLRAIRVLNEVDIILCEDTRVSRKLLNTYEIKSQTQSFHSYSSDAKIHKIITLLEEGTNIALISDAGTPCISDPGGILVAKVRDTLGDSADIKSIPGACAMISALSISGFSLAGYNFLGYLPHKKGRKKIFEEIVQSKKNRCIL